MTKYKNMREDRHLPENIVNSKSPNNDFKLTKLDKKMIDAGNNSAKFSDSQYGSI